MRYEWLGAVPVLATLGLLPAGSAHADTILWISDVNGNIGQVDLTTDVVVANSVQNTGRSLTDIAFNSTGTMYGTTRTKLYSIIPSTGAATDLGTYNVGGGIMNALVGGGGTDLLAASFLTNSVYSVNPSSPGTASIFAPTASGSSGDLAFSGTTLYESGTATSTSDNQLVDVSTDSIVGFFHVGNPSGPELNSVVGLADDGTTMYAVDNTEIYSVDLATAGLTPLFDFSTAENGQSLGDDTGVAFIGEGVSSVPEPATFALFGVALVGLGAVRWIKRTSPIRDGSWSRNSFEWSLLGTTQVRVSALMRFRPVSVSVGRLMEFLATLGQDAEVTVTVKPAKRQRAGHMSVTVQSG